MFTVDFLSVFGGGMNEMQQLSLIIYKQTKTVATNTTVQKFCKIFFFCCDIEAELSSVSKDLSEINIIC